MSDEERFTNAILNFCAGKPFVERMQLIAGILTVFGNLEAAGDNPRAAYLLFDAAAKLESRGAAMSAERDLAEAILVELLSEESIQTAADLFDVLVKRHPDWGSHICMRTVVTAIATEALDAVLARRQSEAARTGPWEGGP